MQKTRKKKTKSLLETESGKAGSPTKKIKWCVLYGFNINDKDDVGYLALRSQDDLKQNPRLGVYEVVKDEAMARKFPMENYDNLPGFAPPEKWLEFFKEEDELSDWRFHLVTKTKFVRDEVDKERDRGEERHVVEH